LEADIAVRPETADLIRFPEIPQFFDRPISRIFPSLFSCSDRGYRGVRKFAGGRLLKLLDEWQNSFAMFGYTLHHSPQQDEDVKSAHRRRNGEAIF
jgi:hypothetical protein